MVTKSIYLQRCRARRRNRPAANSNTATVFEAFYRRATRAGYQTLP